jgi:predicted MFS family arabinose efflux permease
MTRGTGALPAAIGGLCALAIGMGLGRFAYTPLLPHMQEATGMSVAMAGYLASANFLGYLIGALVGATRSIAWSRTTLVRLGLVVCVATIAAMSLTDDFGAWLVLRLVCGVASAFLMVFVSSIVIELLVLGRQPHLNAVLYAGVGGGIALSALTIEIAGRAGLASAYFWGVLGLVAVPLAIVAWRYVQEPARASLASSSAISIDAAGSATRTLRWLVTAYRLYGFGYVVTATFLVLMLRQLPDGRVWENWAWAIVGLAAAFSNGFWGEVATRIGVYRALIAAYLVEALGVTLAALGSGVVAIVIGGALLGGTFVSITALGLPAARALDPHHASRAIASMSAAFALGQMVGPAVAGWIADRAGGLLLPSLAAALALVLGAVIIAAIARGRAR